MADTKRTSADLLTNLFQDGQAAGAISENDVRDFIVSAVPTFGYCYISSTAATSVASQSVYLKAAGTTTAGGSSADMSMSATNRLPYSGTPNRHFVATASISFDNAAGNILVGAKLYHYDNSATSGAVINASEVRVNSDTNSNISAITLIGEVQLSTSDYLEVWISNETNTTNITVQKMTFMAQSILI